MANSSSMIELLIGRILTGLGSAIGTSPAIVYITGTGTRCTVYPPLSSIIAHTGFSNDFSKEMRFLIFQAILNKFQFILFYS